MLIRLVSIVWLCLLISVAQAVDEGELAPARKGIDLVNGSQVMFPEVLKDKPAVLVFLGNLVPLLQSVYALCERNSG